MTGTGFAATDIQPGRAPRWVGPALAILSLAIAAPSLSNGFAYDDVPIIENNPVVHTLSSPRVYLTQGYWPPPGDIVYRPLTVWLFAVQWWIGDGAPIVFHAVNALLFMAGVLLLYRLGLRILPPAGAACAAMLFAVHPVHVEALANVVGQAELSVAAAVLLGVLVYLEGRRRPAFSTARAAALAGILLWAGLAKEQGLMLPLILLAAEATLVCGGSVAERVRQAGPAYLLQVVAGLLLLVLRLGAVPLTGGMQADAIRGASLPGRALTMLGAVPEWLRLFLWPFHLQADYGPGEIVRASGWGPSQLAGLLIVASAAAAVLVWRSRRPVAAFGLLWVAVALFPVSNLLTPTGVVVAERTLYLPSVGVALALGAGAAWLWQRLGQGRPRVAAGAAAMLLLVAPAWRTLTRERVWRDTGTLLAATVRDAPDSYRAWWLLAHHLAEVGDTARATAMYREAAERPASDARFWEEFGQFVRVTTGCEAAVPIFRRGLAQSDSAVVARSRLYYCLLDVGALDEARAVAAEGVSLGDSAFVALMARADSLSAARAESR